MKTNQTNLLHETPKNPLNELKDFIRLWNIDFPIDRWWRKKHKVAFNSPEHREISFFDMAWELYEDKMYEEAFDRYRKLEEEPYNPGDGEWMFRPKLQERISEEEFKELNLDDFDNLE